MRTLATAHRHLPLLLGKGAHGGSSGPRQVLHSPPRVMFLLSKPAQVVSHVPTLIYIPRWICFSLEIKWKHLKITFLDNGNPIISGQHVAVQCISTRQKNSQKGYYFLLMGSICSLFFHVPGHMGMGWVIGIIYSQPAPRNRPSLVACCAMKRALLWVWWGNNLQTWLTTLALSVSNNCSRK